MNTKYRTEAKNEFENNFFKLMNNSVFGKTMEKVRNHRDIKLVTSDKRRKRLVSETNYHSHKKFSEHLMAIEMKLTRVKMIKPIYLGMSILDISKMIVHEFWYDYIKQKYGERAKLCYADTDTFVIPIKTKDFFEDISGDFQRSNYDENDKRRLPIGENKRVTGLFKDEFGGKVTEEVVALRPKTWGYLMDDSIEHKKTKGTKKCVINQELVFENYKDCLSNNKTLCGSQERFKSYYHDVYTEEVNKTALSSNDDKRLQTFDRVTTYPHETNEIVKIKLQ